METPRQTVTRLLGALEALTREEHLLLNHGDYTAAVAVQAREQPIVAHLVELLREPGLARSLDAAIRVRAQGLINAQREQSERLAIALVDARTQLEQVRSAQTRAQQIRPSYGARDSAPALSFAGEA